MRDLQRVIGEEARAQALAAEGALPARVIACVGGGSNAIGIFAPFVDDAEVELIGVEAAGEGIETGRHGASLGAGSTGVLHGSLSAVLADEEGQILEAHSISAGLDYPGVGPEHAYLRDTGRARYVVGHRRAGAGRVRASSAAWRASSRRWSRRTRSPGCWRTAGGDGFDVLCLSGRGDKDLAEFVERAGWLRRWSTGEERIARRLRSRARDEGRAALMPYMMAGFPDRETSLAVADAYADAGADLIELGVPFSDPLADGPTIHAAATEALAAGANAADGAGGLRGGLRAGPGRADGLREHGARARRRRGFAERAAAAGAAGAIVPDLPLGEAEEIREAFAAAGLALVPLVAPTTPAERRARICAVARGFVYVVSTVGTTGERDELPPELAELVAATKADAEVPVAVGFGIGTPEQAAEVGEIADGVIIGSRLVRAAGEAGSPPRRPPTVVRVPARDARRPRRDRIRAAWHGRRTLSALAAMTVVYAWLGQGGPVAGLVFFRCC